ncbi:TPA: hypothetical protein HA361_05255 [Candidatus Woesearchaeota archaeon]|nr:hypothetical protein [Candidatus Woesearchaeota archaeon]HII68328.1 hypothetical protein [Candidatus Woesearchaeota archaeon]
MNTIIFDAGPIISLALNNLLWVLNPLEKEYRGKFCITEGVKKEIVDAPLLSKRFKFEALQVMRQIKDGTLAILSGGGIERLGDELLNLANRSFSAKGNPIHLVDYGEITTVAASILHQADAIVVDERTTRLLIENPLRLQYILSHKLHTQVNADQGMLRRFHETVKHIKVIRSVELITVAYEMGVLDSYVPDLPDARRHLLDSVLWGVKLQGCAVSRNEIEQIMRLEFRQRPRAS